ncbi:hypothetical protein [Schlesneria paludicola]|uniref:hypothetical protein n=1 Tax=Schlesneria paludicola TaxID=360056 RepID=UPI00029A33CD|nr:hypothetical protein [Schlesneria paludicola]
MKVSRLSLWVGGLAVFAVAMLVSQPAISCPFCSAPSLTLSEQVSQADAVVLVSWAGGQPAKISDSGSTDFEIVDVVQQPEGGKLAKGGKINLIRYRAAKVGDQFMLFGTKVESAIEWSSPLEVSKTAYEYIRSAPKPGGVATERLKYFLKYLETSDKMIADDAFGEFANAAYADVVKLSADLPRDQLRIWINSKDVAPGRLGLYGMMLGLCGNDDDAKLMEARILEPTEDFRLQIDGVMGGYLLLTGDKGLTVLENEKLKNKKAPFSETYAAMQAVRFMWQYGDGRISAERLRESMRILLARQELVDLVIADLSRMKDWSVQDQLMALYDDEANIPSVKRAIVRYMLSSAKDTGEKKVDSTTSGGAGAIPTADAKPPAELPAHVVKAQKCLEELERKDPKTVNEAKRFFLLK